MKRLDLSVGQRLAAGSTIIVILIAIVGTVVALSAWRVRALQREQTALIEPRAMAADALESAIYQQAIAFRNFGISRSDADYQTFRRAEQQVNERIAAIHALPKTPDGQAVFDQIPPLVAAHRQSFDDYIAMAAATADRETLRRQEIVVSNYRAQVLQKVHAFSTIQDQLRNAARDAIGRAIQRLFTTVLLLTAIIIIASALTAYVVSRSVRQPALELAAAADAIRNGSYSEALALAGVRSGGHFRDELREAGRVFGRMAAALKDRDEMLQAQNEELQAQNEELQTQSEELQAQAEELQSQAEELRTQSDELRGKEELLTRTNQALLAAEEQKDRFLATLGHELRNPLAAIRGAISVIGNNGEVSPMHDIIRRQTAHLARLVDDLLDISRINSGKIVLARKPLDLAAIVERCVASIAANANGSAAPQIRIEVAERVWVDGDETRIEQIVTNLLTNSLKFTNSDGVISVHAGRDGSDAIVRVTDSGRGIDPDLLPRIFDVFVQGESDRTNGHNGGLGLGLTVVKNLVELHGGTVKADSDGRGRGTTMTVRLPALAELPVIDVATKASDPLLATKRSIVLVEDNADVRRMMSLLLAHAGHTVNEAHDGPSGVETVTAVKPEVALVDLDLPGFDGCELARRVRLDPQLENVRLIALSGYGRPEDRARAIAAGFDDHVVKPVDFDLLSNLVVERRSATESKPTPLG